jgi:hypothetical protein
MEFVIWTFLWLAVIHNYDQTYSWNSMKQLYVTLIKMDEMSVWNLIWPLCLSFHITWGNTWGITHHPFALSPFTYSGHKQKGTLVFMNIRCLIHLRNFSQCSLCNKDPLEFWKMALQRKASALWDERWEKELHFGDVMMLILWAADSPFPLKSSTKKKESDYNSLFHGTWQAQELL